MKTKPFNYSARTSADGGNSSGVELVGFYQSGVHQQLQPGATNQPQSKRFVTVAFRGR